ncbi:MAG: hypothetical protein INQ03_12780 [Candidatus Heimdallarchaeota archaeon]|nr:hypothetical protein [Candidatus Heimdallarchaeota archaeon]
MVHIIRFNALEHDADDPFWDKYYEFNKASHADSNNDEPIMAKETIIKRQHEQQRMVKKTGFLFIS